MADSPVTLMKPAAWRARNNKVYTTTTKPRKEVIHAYDPLYAQIEWEDQWGCVNIVSPREAANLLKDFFDAYPGGLEEVELAIKGQTEINKVEILKENTESC